MRKKYLSALLFGALLFASAGTFTSCKDYDDDIENLQSQISANKEAIAKLQSLVDAGDYVTGVSKDASGNLVFAFSKSGPKTIELDKPEKAQKLEIKGGELYIDDAPTGIKVAEPAKPVEDTHKDQIIIENGAWSVLQEDGTYKSTGIPVSGVTAVKNDKQQWVLTITDANGATAKVTVPSAASVMSDLELVGWFNTNSAAYDAANNILDLGNVEGQNLSVTTQDIAVNYCYIAAITKVYDSNKETTWSAQKDVVKKQVLTTLAAEGTKLVARVAPADLDLSSLNFSLQDSKGNKLPISLTSSNFTGKLTRATANSSIHFLSLDITDATYDAANNYSDLFGGNDDLYSLVEESGARSTYGKFGIKATPYAPTYTPLVNKVNPDGTLSSSATQGDGLSATTPFIVDLNTPTKLVFSQPKDVYDYYVEPVDQAAADEFGFSTDKKKGTITLTKSIDLVTRAALELNVYALRVDGKIFKSSVWVKPSSILSAAVTLKAGEKVITPIMSSGVISVADNTQFTVSLADMFASMSATDKSRWMSSVTGANGGFEIAEFKNADGAYNSGTYTGVTFGFLKADGTAGNNTNAASLLVTVPYKAGTTALLTPYKEYTMTLNFLHDEGGSKSVMNTVKVTVTPTLPTLSSYITKRSALWDGNKLMAYFDDPASPTVVLDSKYTMNNGFTKLGWKDNATTPNTLLDITFAMDGDQKLEASDGNKYAASNTNVTAVTGNVIEIKKTYNDKVRTNMPLAYGKDLNVKVNAKYMGVYNYSDYATTKAQLADAAFQIKVQSALEAGTIAPANGSSISLTPSGASRLMQITAKDIKATAYNQDAPYNVFKEVLATTPSTTIGWRYSYIKDVKFESADNLLYTVENGGAAVDPTYDATANKEVESYVSLKAGNTTSATETTIKVTVTDWYGYTKVVNLPITINKANTGNN